MTKKVFRPFWTFDVQETEECLSSMAAGGYRLKKIRGFGLFVLRLEMWKASRILLIMPKERKTRFPLRCKRMDG